MSNNLTSSWADAAEDDDFAAAPAMFASIDVPDTLEGPVTTPSAAAPAAQGSRSPARRRSRSPARRRSRSPPRRRRSRSRSPPRRRRSRSRSPPRRRRSRSPPPRRERAPPVIPTSPPFSLFCGSLPFEANEDDLKDFFADDGEITAVRLIRQRDSQRHKGYGYVEFATAEGLKTAVERDGVTMMGRQLRLDVATPKQGGNGGGRGGGGRRDRNNDFWGRARNNNDREPRGPPKERPKLNLAPRSKPLPGAVPEEAPKRGSNPFGDAKPRDETDFQRAKERERLEREKKEAEAKKDTKPKARNNDRNKQNNNNNKGRNNNNNNNNKPRNNNNNKNNEKNDSKAKVEVEEGGWRRVADKKGSKKSN